MPSPITLDALRVLDAIERRQSFAAAADALHRVPSAISYTVNKLEEDLGVSLFDRSKRKAQLTPVGRLVLEQGRLILQATDELTHLAKEAAEGWEVELRVAIDTLLDMNPLYRLIKEFHGVHRRTQVRVTEEVLAGSWDALLDNRCDLVIGAEGDPPTAGFSCFPIARPEMVLAVSPDHPLCGLPRPPSEAEIRQHPNVVVSDTSRGLPARSVGLLDGQTRIFVPNIACKIAAQCQGLGIGHLPKYRIHKELAEGRLVILEQRGRRSSQQLSVAWRSSNRGKALAWFIQRLQSLPDDWFVSGEISTNAPHSSGTGL